MLREVFPEILASYKNYASTFKHNNKIFKCMKGDQLSVLEQSFQDMESAIARQHMIDNAVSLNFIQKIVSKLSQIYTFDVTRTASSNQDLVDYYKEAMSIDDVMQNADELFNGMRSCLVEIYQKKDKSLAARPIPSDRFFVWSDDLLEPNIPTVYVKIVGFCNSLTKKGQKAELFFAYTDTEFLAFDSDGSVRTEYLDGNDGVNVFGVAPFVYINRDIYDLIPTSNKDLLQNVILICKTYTEAKVANHFQSFPIRILKNVDLESSKIDINVNSVVVLNSKDGSGVSPEFTELPSSLDTQKSIDLAKEMLYQLLYTFDINAEGAVSDASGLALTIKASDTLDNRKKQIESFKPAEKEFWHKLSIIHNSIVKRNVVGPKTPKTTFDADFEITVSFELPDTSVEQSNATGEQTPADESKPVTSNAVGDEVKEVDDKKVEE